MSEDGQMCAQICERSRQNSTACKHNAHILHKHARNTKYLVHEHACTKNTRVTCTNKKHAHTYKYIVTTRTHTQERGRTYTHTRTHEQLSSYPPALYSSASRDRERNKHSYIPWCISWYALPLLVTKSFCPALYVRTAVHEKEGFAKINLPYLPGAAFCTFYMWVFVFFALRGHHAHRSLDKLVPTRRADHPDNIEGMPRSTAWLVFLSLATASCKASAAAHDLSAPPAASSAFVSYVPVTASFNHLSRAGRAFRRAIPGSRPDR